MKSKEILKKIVDKLVCLLLLLVLFIGCFFITGCPEAQQVMKPVVEKPTEEPAEMPTTTGGEVKQEPKTDPEPAEETEQPMETAEVPGEEPIETKPEEPASTVTLPPGYELPPELIPDTPPTLSKNEAALAKAEKQVKKVYPDIEPDAAPTLQTQAGYTADLLSLLPHAEREEVYDLFVGSIDLPFFGKAAEKMKEVNIQLITLGGEAYENGNWGPYDVYLEKTNQERGLNHITSRELEDIYFEENPQDMQYEDGNSRYWMILEWYRLQLAHPEVNINSNFRKMVNLYRKSCADGRILGLDNPWY